ncbi:MAG: ribonuclease P protein component 1 [Halobacteriaceae archaeon]
MAPTPATLPAHELTGLAVEVVDDADPGRVGITGRVVAETRNTLVVRTDAGDRRVPKATAAFAFDLATPRTVGVATEDSTANNRGGRRGERVVITGDRLVARPARRTQRSELWH